MAAIAWIDVEAHAPELAGSAVPTSAQTDILAHVNTALDADEWGGETAARLKMARVYLAAHYGTQTKNKGGAGGPVAVESAGPLSRQYAVPSPLGTDPEFVTTNYGKAYLSLVRALPARAPLLI